MKKVIRKLFWAWDFDKEEQWLNDQAANGLALTSVGWCRYEFEDCQPGAYQIRMDYFENSAKSPENARYIEFLEETGAEHVGTVMGWGYFRKRTQGEDFQLFSDAASRIRLLDRVITLITVLAGLNLFLGVLNVLISVFGHTNNFSVAVPNLMIGVLGFAGIRRLRQKQKKLKADQQIFE